MLYIIFNVVQFHDQSKIWYSLKDIFHSTIIDDRFFNLGMLIEKKVEKYGE